MSPHAASWLSAQVVWDVLRSYPGRSTDYFRRRLSAAACGFTHPLYCSDSAPALIPGSGLFGELGSPQVFWWLRPNFISVPDGSSHRKITAHKCSSGTYVLLMPHTHTKRRQASSVSCPNRGSEREAIQESQRSESLLVMLLAQGESGNLTLQKQLQLLNLSETLNTKRPSWGMVVHANERHVHAVERLAGP
ncbi:hypothetical protein K438DRAFT_1774315 [Mycena galopus ATCC 62051]|nr:hypothetical protein K438DRAFT_1774315 [Mycena galopus ATCC 62051]